MTTGNDEDVRGAIADEVLSELRHELRNNLSTIRNAMFYVRRRIVGSELYDTDPRLRRFFDLVEVEIANASALVERGLSADRQGTRGVGGAPARGPGAKVRPPARVLLVDDDESVRITLAALLEDEGFSVELAGSSAEARSRISEGSRYDLVLLDQNLGDGLGIDLVPRLRAEVPMARIVLLSGVEADPSDPSVDARVAKGEAPEALFRALRGNAEG